MLNGLEAYLSFLNTAKFLVKFIASTPDVTINDIQIPWKPKSNISGWL
jgi:hypothetical protein